MSPGEVLDAIAALVMIGAAVYVIADLQRSRRRSVQSFAEMDRDLEAFRDGCRRVYQERIARNTIGMARIVLYAVDKADVVMPDTDREAFRKALEESNVGSITPKTRIELTGMIAKFQPRPTSSPRTTPLN